MYLAIFILFIVIATEIISWIGHSQLATLTYKVYLKFFQVDTITKQSTIKKQILQLKNDLAHTSSQDEFAKWAKIRRKIDKGVAELEKINSDLAFLQTAFNLRFNTLLYAFTRGTQIFMMFWYRKSAVFYVPRGWFGPFGWWLSFPTAPSGSVSVFMWFTVCKRVLKGTKGIVNGLSESLQLNDVVEEEEGQRVQ